ncbi:MAG TPA: hypothetical protein VG319_01620 [Polyangia bacterium]|jgi:hypothetical protein|nr:hypothetical protein [Polyangia bacterium]
MNLKPRLGLALGLSVVLAGVVAPFAHASLVIALDLPTMVERADHVAVVDVAAVSAAWDAQHARILTTIDLSVVDAWKGPMTPASHLRIVQPGGTVGDIQMTVFGMSRFSPGERALVFLRGTPEAASVVGMAQGKRLVGRDVATGRWMVHAPEPAGASFVRAAPTPAQPHSTTATPPIFETRPRALDELRAEVRGLVGKATGR